MANDISDAVAYEKARRKHFFNSISSVSVCIRLFTDGSFNIS